MWAPDDVVPRNKKRASAVWVLLLILIISYTIWLFVTAFQKRKNPSISLWIEEGYYPFPDLTLCPVANNGLSTGCDSYQCASEVYTTVMGNDAFVVQDWTEIEFEENAHYPGECVDIRLSQFEFNPDYNIEESIVPPTMGVLTIWYTSLSTENTSQITEISESVASFVSDPRYEDPLGLASSFLGKLPYNRFAEGDTVEEISSTTVSMEMTESIDLDENSARTYSAASVSSSPYFLSVGPFDGGDVGIMYVQFVQPSLSHTIRKEIDPLEWTELIGNVGGTWEFLLILWSILFVASQHEEPSLKARNLKKSVIRGTERVVSATTSVASFRRKKSSVQAGTSADEQRPAWDTSSNAAGQQSEMCATTPAFNAALNSNVSHGSRSSTAAGANTNPQSSYFGQAIAARPSSQEPIVQDIPRPAYRPNAL